MKTAYGGTHFFSCWDGTHRDGADTKNDSDPCRRQRKSITGGVCALRQRCRHIAAGLFGGVFSVWRIKYRASGGDLTFATQQPCIRKANVKSKTPLETYIC